MTVWEHSLRVPLIISAPWLTTGHGQYHHGMAEMCDFYKTLSDLAGINPDTVDKGVEGDSLAEAVANPSMQGKLYAFSQTNRVGVASLKAEVPPRHLPNLFSRLPVTANGYFDPSGFSADSDLEWMGYVGYHTGVCMCWWTQNSTASRSQGCSTDTTRTPLTTTW